MIIRIPEQLRTPDYRFIRIADGKKIPPIDKWRTEENQFTYNHPKLIRHLYGGGNYGIVCGVGNLIVVDFDSQEMQDTLLPLLPETFRVMTAGKQLLHLYFKTDNPQTMRVDGE